jgi:hypothetical protein
VSPKLAAVLVNGCHLIPVICDPAASGKVAGDLHALRLGGRGRVWRITGFR